jgi:SAM-dependent methyltransferase
MKNFANEIYRKVINIPFVWTTGQNFLGANQWKSSIYRSVFKTTGRLLDFGCSIGNLTGNFLDFEYYGIDTDKTAIERAKKTFSGAPHVSFFALDIVKEGFKKDFFDHILFACTGHHLSNEELPKVFTALLENLRVGGEIHFFDPIRQAKDVWVTRFINNHDQGKFVRTIGAYEKFFEERGYKVTERQIFESPRSFIKLPDIYYVGVMKER